MPNKTIEHYQNGQLVSTTVVVVGQDQVNADAIASGLRAKLTELQGYRTNWANITTAAQLRVVLRAVLTVCIWLLRKELADYLDAEDA